ncbi:hypothetical protein CN200_19670 [Sinorhizobium meliloti]|uniref:hypothetical protein n=1 Tax=Rhizobium meliloti TaxID=382 RepID=UPI000FD1A7BD|nr:hypothetical protein [Sinorhizobium meliloti]RVI14545.1 hypothetical protein CN200_19670 [Sinorhizobium meliloti]RVN81091.1 hypothetical protein CN107_27590 [Sinorhizobium meliloti]RVO03126.1 hypothetical protein CN103_25265 [Sinorhizobium meliloti]
MNSKALADLANGLVVTVAECGEAGKTTEVWQDKRPHIAARSVGCFDWIFPGFPHITAGKRDVRIGKLLCTFNGNRTSQRKDR